MLPIVVSKLAASRLDYDQSLPTAYGADMSDENQIEIAQSFMALYIDPGRHKPNASREVIAGRYELCEDLANMLTQTAKDMLFDLGLSEDAVLQRCYLGLVGNGAVVSAPESVWVIRRLAELLDWPQPSLAEAG